MKVHCLYLFIDYIIKADIDNAYQKNVLAKLSTQYFFLIFFPLFRCTGFLKILRHLDVPVRNYNETTFVLEYIHLKFSLQFPMKLNRIILSGASMPA